MCMQFRQMPNVLCMCFSCSTVAENCRTSPAEPSIIISILYNSRNSESERLDLHPVGDLQFRRVSIVKSQNPSSMFISPG